MSFNLFATVFGCAQISAQSFMLDSSPFYSPLLTPSFGSRLIPDKGPKRNDNVLLMARGGIHGKKKRMLDSAKKKKRKNPNRPPGKHRKTSKRDKSPDVDESAKRSPVGSPTRATLSFLNEAKKPGPPWQIMNEKDMKKNVSSEKVRRDRIQSGLDSSSEDQSTTSQKIKADVSGSNSLLSTSDRYMINWKRFNPDTACSDLMLVGSYLGKELPPSLGVPEVAFLGRSNVGKSSLLNRLVAKAGGDTARVGKTPGATASVNLYALLGPHKRKEGSRPIGSGGAKPILGFADLPGFGYAKLSKATKESVEEAAERYLGKRRDLALGVLLVDSRRIPSPDDRAVLAALFDMGVPLIVVATKSDKLKSNELEPAMKSIRDGLGLPDGQPLRVSGVTGEGIKDLWRIILDACETRVIELKSAMEEGRDDGGNLRLSAEENNEEEFYEDCDGEEEDMFDEDEDLHYDQGYDWIQSDSGDEIEDFYSSFSDEDYILSDEKME